MMIQYLVLLETILWKVESEVLKEIYLRYVEKYQPHWKPNEEQIATLEKWLKDKQFDGASRYAYPIFESLYEQLKKLM